MDRRKILKIAKISSTAAILAGTASFLVTKLLVDTALDREAPKFFKIPGSLISGSPADKDLAKIIEQKAEELALVPHREVEITAPDGIKLKGHWYHRQTDKRAVVAMHGWRSSWKKDFGSCYKFFLDKDCSILFAEQRGQNSSEGSSMGFGLTERFDCIEWAKFVQKNTRLPIYLAGVSMGATTVLMASGLDLPKRVKGIIADCGFTSPYDIWKHVSENNLHIPFGLKGIFANALCRKKINMPADGYSTLKALKKATVPVLFIHGTDDKFVPVEMTYENYAACSSQKRLFLVPGAGHGMSYPTDPSGYETAVSNFFEDFDG